MSDTDLKWLRTTPIAHRGLFGPGIPENSLAAFREAISKNYAIELDVRLSKDGQPVICHDPTTTRVADIDLNIRRSNLSDLVAVKFKNSSEKIPSLHEALALTRGKVPVLIEIKSGSPIKKICMAVTQELRNYRGPHAICSFDPRVVRWFYDHARQIPRGQSGGGMWETKKPAIIRILSQDMPLNPWTKPQFLVYELRDSNNGMFLLHQKMNPLPVILWPVRTPSELVRSKTVGANVIFEQSCGLDFAS